MPTLQNLGGGIAPLPAAPGLPTIGNIGNGPFNSRVTYYAPGPGDRMEGAFATSRPNPATGQRIPSTLDDVRLGRSPFVTVASDPSRYGQKVQLGDLTYRSPIDGKTYTVPNVQGVVHDTGSAFKGRPDKLDVAAGDFRGWTPQAASAYVQNDAGRRQVLPAGWEAGVGTEAPSGGSVGYTGAGIYANPAPRADASAPRSWEQILADFASGLGPMKAAQLKPLENAKFGQATPFKPLTGGVESFR